MPPALRIQLWQRAMRAAACRGDDDKPHSLAPGLADLVHMCNDALCRSGDCLHADYIKPFPGAYLHG